MRRRDSLLLFFPGAGAERSKSFLRGERDPPSEELEIEGFRHNPKNRCYLCKHELFEKIWDIARELGLNAVAEGSNMDDNGDYRPGLVAVRELGVLSPLRHVGLNKAEIRELSRELGLPTWNKQSFACLSIARNSCFWIWAFTRCVYGSTASLPGSRPIRQSLKSCCRSGRKSCLLSEISALPM